MRNIMIEKFSSENFGESLAIYQIHQSFPSSYFCAIQYCVPCCILYYLKCLYVCSSNLSFWQGGMTVANFQNSVINLSNNQPFNQSWSLHALSA